MGTLMLFLALFGTTALSFVASTDICAMSCGPQRKVSFTEWCHSENGTVNGTCCFDGNYTKIGDISGNPSLSPNETFNVNVFRGMTHLTTLKLDAPQFDECPIQRQVKTRFVTECQVKCPENSHCIPDGPALLQCVCDEGWSGYKCLKKPEPRVQGLKSLEYISFCRSQGTFPYFMYFACLIASTVVLSGLLWYTQRRFVRVKRD